MYWPDYHDGLFGELWRFGPCYPRAEAIVRQEEKQHAFDFVLEKSKPLFPHILDRLKASEGEARAAYSEDALPDISGDEFVNMMAIDGCFNLLVAFSILGQGIFGFKIGFEDSHGSFGTGFVRDNMEMWLQSMFLVGNQIPFVVLEQLMKLRFFEGLKRRYKWKQPSGLLKRAVHMLLTTELDPKPVDLIHCLQICLLGTRSGSDVGISIMVNDVGGDEVDDLPSAVELCRKGIAFAALGEGLGSRGIHYKHDPFNGVLYLPIFKVDRYTALMVECLHKYEIVQKARGIKPESTSFFKLLSELIRTEQDVDLFSSQGVILGGSAEALPEILSEFDDVEPCDFDQPAILSYGCIEMILQAQQRSLSKEDLEAIIIMEHFGTIFSTSEAIDAVIQSVWR
ncbi:uncharacterized protein [Coffea arabica]|uniref:Uncharacterized protein n=1 Tax=Coffea arabica TaxID=13443 RepID=A0ABM4X5R9_COFAR